MPFTTSGCEIWSKDGLNGRSLTEVRYWTNVHGFLELIILPIGSWSDGGSMPEEVWGIPGFAPFGDGWMGYRLHDGGYRGDAETEKDGIRVKLAWDRETWDKILLEALENLGIDKIHRETIYICVRKCGQPAWDKDHSARSPESTI